MKKKYLKKQHVSVQLYSRCTKQPVSSSCTASWGPRSFRVKHEKACSVSFNLSHEQISSTCTAVFKAYKPTQVKSLHCAAPSSKSNHFIKLLTQFAPVTDGWSYISQESGRSSSIVEQLWFLANPITSSSWQHILLLSRMVGHHRSLWGHHPLWHSCDFLQIQSLHQAGNTLCSRHRWLAIHITGVCEVIVDCGTVHSSRHSRGIWMAGQPQKKPKSVTVWVIKSCVTFVGPATCQTCWKLRSAFPPCGQSAEERKKKMQLVS